MVVEIFMDIRDNGNMPGHLFGQRFFGNTQKKSERIADNPCRAESLRKNDVAAVCLQEGQCIRFRTDNPITACGLKYGAVGSFHLQRDRFVPGNGRDGMPAQIQTAAFFQDSDHCIEQKLFSLREIGDAAQRRAVLKSGGKGKQIVRVERKQRLLRFPHFFQRRVLGQHSVKPGSGEFVLQQEGENFQVGDVFLQGLRLNPGMFGDPVLKNGRSLPCAPVEIAEFRLPVRKFPGQFGEKRVGI